MVSEQRPAALETIVPDRIVDVDVRDELRAGREPFSLIMAARRQLPADGALRVRAIFEPAPLYAVLGKQGLAHWTEELGPEDWVVWFYPAQEAPAVGAVGESPATAVDDDVVVLDVRGLEPPEPLLQTLAALEQLPAGSTLVQINERVPQFLLPQLHSRGYTWKTVEEGGVVRVFISRATE